MSPVTIPSLLAALASMPDPRAARGRRHPLPALLALLCLALLCGVRSQRGMADWLADQGDYWRRQLGFTHPNGPSQSTLHRVLAQLDVLALEACLAQWSHQVLAGLPATPLPALAVDGKTLRTSAQHGADPDRVVTVCTHHLGLVLAQVGLAPQAAELSVFEQVMADVLLDGVVLTADAAFTQRNVATQVRARGGHYLLPVKGNQAGLLDDVRWCFDGSEPLAAEQVDSHGGRIERRRLWTEPMLAEFSDFPGVAQALRLERRVMRQRTGEIQTEARFAITSLTPQQASPAQLLGLWRGHWTIENRLHWVRDVTLGEDRCAVRCATAPQVLVALRNAVLAVLRATGVTNVARALRRFSVHPHEAAQLIGLPGL